MPGGRADIAAETGRDFDRRFDVTALQAPLDSP